MKLLLTVLFLLLFNSEKASAEWARGVGEYAYGPDIAENIACQNAEKRAIRNAIQAVAGERIKDEDLLICQEQHDTANCKLNKMTLSITDGVVRGIKEKTRQIFIDKDGLKRCTITLYADIIVALGEPDPSFDLAISLNQRTFREGDALTISVDVTKPMFINVLQWLPYEEKRPQVSRLFPNDFDPEKRFENQGQIPTAGRNYTLQVQFPKSLKKNISYADEYLIVVGTRKPMLFKKRLSLLEFNERLVEIPRSERRHIKKAYNIMRGP